ncbi:uncharacterized protein TNCV_1150081 [Trichonephila clavipes]|nr:uncharacterized protein TNCV_1150081 [Trichonephila clavipes]
MDESEIIPINDYDSDLESETDSEISINDSGSIDSFSDDFDFDISDDENDDLSQARNFYEIDCNNPSAPPPRFAFTNTSEIHLDFDASSGNFYSSPELADILIQSLTDMYGTLKPRRKDVPKELLSKKIDKGQIIAYQRGKVCVMKWMDKKAVCLISTIHIPEMVQVQSHKNEIRRKPKAVMEYNNTTGGVDRLDQHLTNYPLIKKRGNGYGHELVAGVSWARALLPLKTRRVGEAIPPADVVIRKEWFQLRCPPRHSNEVQNYMIPAQLACAYLKGHLKGRALDWFEVLGYRVIEDKTTDYAHLKQALSEQFPVVRNRSELETRFYSSSQRDQQPSDFIYELLKIHKILKLEMSEEKLIHHVVSRLEPQILDYVEVRHPRNTANLLQIVDKYEERFIHRQIRGSSEEFRSSGRHENNRFNTRHRQENWRENRNNERYANNSRPQREFNRFENQGFTNNRRFEGRRQGGQSDQPFHSQGGRQSGSRNSSFRGQNERSRNLNF